jgi:gluconokinase
LIVVVMGVSGSGKSTVGQRLAAELGWRFHDADDFHPPENLARMERGEPLTDEHRQPWLERLAALISSCHAAGTPAVLACSALKASYRARLRAAVPPGELRVVYLRLGRDLAAARVGARGEHFMPVDLVESQFAALEEPREAVVVEAQQPLPQVLAAIREALGA